jgi:predicted transcriptional regulator
MRARHFPILPCGIDNKRFDTTGDSHYTARMEVRFTPEQAARLLKVAAQEGIDPEELVKDAALRLLEDDTRFRAGVQMGIGQADRGQFVEEEEMDARVKRLFRS